jgi:NAD(P)-dependent dehydrogenase (short-subunit alcohol dehydrogenase family)
MFAAYCAAKAGLEMLVRCAAEELGEHRVRVNAVRPGLTRTDATTGMFADEDVVAAYMEQQPLDREGEADDIAGAIRYFCGPESSGRPVSASRSTAAHRCRFPTSPAGTARASATRSTARLAARPTEHERGAFLSGL